jgi:hypothetical protein
MLRPTAKEVTALDNYKLLIKFDNGEVKLFDTSVLLSKKPFMPLKDKIFFKKVKTNGITVE